MTEPFQSRAMQQAPFNKKIVAYGLLVPVVGLLVYGIGRLLVSTILIAFPNGFSLYQTVCLPVIFFLIPLLTFAMPFSILRDATETKTRNLIIGSIITLAIITLIAIFTPDIASILWGF